MRIHAFIVSKDRAAQLHLLLRSLRINASYIFRPYILWTASNGDFLAGYEKLQKEFNYLYVDWIKETNLMKQFLGAMRWAQNAYGYICMFTDDSVFFRNMNHTNSKTIIDTFKDSNILCFSFRLGKNTIVQNYRTGQRQHPLQNYTIDEHEFIKWNWKQYEPHFNYGYPIAQDGCVYDAHKLLAMSLPYNFKTMRSWEGVLSGPQHRQTLQQELICSPQHSAVVNIPVNCMQEHPVPCSRNIHVSPKELNHRFLNNEIIDLHAMDFSNVVGCHQEIELKFRKRNEVSVHSFYP